MRDRRQCQLSDHPAAFRSSRSTIARIPLGRAGRRGLPNTPSLVGATFHHQMVPIELDGAANWTAITATNSLQLTAGAL
ncbi:MAG: hypothetical protein MUC36_19440 [Planctomycetes bacterium]|nr:hypothetical protein [Planctomycetota bacterium]